MTFVTYHLSRMKTPCLYVISGKVTVARAMPEKVRACQEPTNGKCVVIFSGFMAKVRPWVGSKGVLTSTRSTLILFTASDLIWGTLFS